MEARQHLAAIDSGPARPPGPKGRLILGNVREINSDPLSAITRWVRQYGDIVRFRLLHFPVYLLARPEYIEQVLVTKNRNFTKSRDYRGMAAIFGNGLLTSEGQFWMRQRRLMQPAFSHERIPSYAAMMLEYTEQMLATWRDGEVRDVHEDMMALTLRIVAKTLFGADVHDEAPAVGEALGDIMRSLWTEAVFLPVLQKLPTRRNRRFKRAIARLDETIYRIIEQRRRDRPSDSGDVLGMLLAARDDDGSAMTDEQLRDEVMTLFLAGHETTALALSWTWVLLAQNSDVEKKLCEELDAGEPNPAYTRMVLTESMRIYPPVWTFGRQAISECEIGGYRIPAGAQIWISPWIMHRDARYFEEPERFRPERWQGDLAKRLPRYAYFPFGGGPRLCIGQSFALMEGALILASVARRFRLSLAPDANIALLPSISLRPLHGVRMIVSKR